MNIEIIKEELIKRYRFIYENALFILGPLVKEVNSPFLGLEKVINLLDLPEDCAYLLEEFLLTDKEMEETPFYKKMLELKNNSSYLLAVKEGLSLLNKKNASTYPSLKEELTVFEVLQLVREYIDSQESDINNKEKKLCVLDEYFRISRYTNDKNTWISGAELEVSDISKGIKIKSGIRKRNIKVS